MQKQATKTATKTATKRAAKNKPQAAKTDTQAQAEKPAFNATRDAATIARNATAFAELSERDVAYLRLYGDAMRANGHKATLAEIAAAGKPVNGRITNPYYNGSAKATDAGAANRLRKAGYITISAAGNVFTATDAARDTAAYRGK